MILQIMRLPHAADLPLPRYATDGAAGFDLCAAIDGTRRINAGARALIPTGFAVAIPDGHEIQIRPRSGLALRQGIAVHFGTVDQDYRGEIGLIVQNFGHNDFYVQRGDRLAQGIVCPVVRVHFSEVDALDETARGAGGFGSTGTR